MKKLILFILVFAINFSGTTLLNAQCNSHQAVKVKQSHHEKDLVDIASNSDQFTTLVAAVKAAGLVETLKGDGPFTIFAPTNIAFDKLPDGTVETLLKKENKSTLTNILTYHVIAGSFTATEVIGAIKAGGGSASFKMVNGGQLTASLSNGNVILKDENGNKSAVIKTDVKGSNGVIHVIDMVVLPK